MSASLDLLAAIQDSEATLFSVSESLVSLARSFRATGNNFVAEKLSGMAKDLESTAIQLTEAHRAAQDEQLSEARASADMSLRAALKIAELRGQGSEDKP